ncbi:MAG: DUF3309 family protein [Rhodospirillaceae bacterium]|nr:DUF3309 family protein [Rhodospirillaceae bacterium]
MHLLLIIVLALLVAGALPIWPHDIVWGFLPAGIAIILIGLIVLLLIRGAKQSLRSRDTST